MGLAAILLPAGEQADAGAAAGVASSAMKI